MDEYEFLDSLITSLISSDECPRENSESNNNPSCLYENKDSADENNSNVHPEFIYQKKRHFFVEAVEPKFVFVPKPRIVKSDIRRIYTNMLVNSLNAIEFPLVFGFLETYCTPNVKLTIITHNPITNINQPIKMQGIESLALFWYTTMIHTPDAVTLISDTNIHLSSNTNKSKIVAKTKYRGTQIYSTPNTNQTIFSSVTNYLTAIKNYNNDSDTVKQEDTHNSSTNKKRKVIHSSAETALQQSNRNNSNTCRGNGYSDRFQVILQAFQDISSNLPLFTTPQPSFVTGSTTVMYLDNESRITDITFDCETPLTWLV